MPRCHFLLIVIVIAITSIHKEFFKNKNMSKMFQELSFVKLLTVRIFSKVIRYNKYSKPSDKHWVSMAVPSKIGHGKAK